MISKFIGGGILVAVAIFIIAMLESAFDLKAALFIVVSAIVFTIVVFGGVMLLLI